MGAMLRFALDVKTMLRVVESWLMNWTVFAEATAIKAIVMSNLMNCILKYFLYNIFVFSCSRCHLCL